MLCEQQTVDGDLFTSAGVVKENCCLLFSFCMNPSHSSFIVPAVRTGQGSALLSREEFSRRYQAQFYDPAFDEAKEEIQRLTDRSYRTHRTYSFFFRR